LVTGGKGRSPPGAALLGLLLAGDRGGDKNPPASVIVPLIVALGKAVAVNPTGEPVKPALVAVTVWDPTCEPSVCVAVAWPFAPVVLWSGAIDPPPDVTAQSTVTPETPFPNASDALTEYGIGSADPARADCASPPERASCDADAGLELAVKVTGEPDNPATVAVAVSLLEPAVRPSFGVAEA
jgi:hypothetical protein